ncbi:hypothetical protein BYT27DRAFT_6384066 [Phlegmacium glaucopus]|nr:hypothetical protein BYT27DRAFT_6384066 [Phlegmacium glaucopus]
MTLFFYLRTFSPLLSQFLAPEISLSASNCLFSSPSLYPRFHLFCPDHMSPYRKPLPSFTLVLTSGHHSYSPATIQLCSAIPPTAPEFLMKTIDLRHDSTDNEFVEVRDENVDSQTVFEGEPPATFDHVAAQTSTRSVKNLFFLIHKLVTFKWKFAACRNGPNVPP